MSLTPAQRWRLILGNAADESEELTGDALAMDQALSWLYDRDEGDGAGPSGQGSGGGSGGPGQNRSRRSIRGPGGTSSAGLATVDWLNDIGRLFPKETIERLEKDAIERYQIDDVLTDAEVLERMEPSTSLLKAVLKTKHLMDPEVLAAARRVVERVVQDLVDKLKPEIRQSFSGTRSRTPTRVYRQARNFDFQTTVRRNLQHWNHDEQRLYIDQAHFHARHRRHLDTWQVILVVDQSGSMAGSVIHSAVTASILWSLPGVRAHLVAFDTRVVDLTSDVTDPVELLMKVQLGGGTDIASAVDYASRLIDNPRKTIFVLVTDFYEGGSPAALVRLIGQMADQGTKVLGLAALDIDAEPFYDRDIAEQCAAAGAYIGAMTPGELAAFVAETIG